MTSPPPTAPSRSLRGNAVVLNTLAVAVVAMIFAVNVALNVLDGRIRDRTIWGVLLMALGLLAIVVAAAAIVRWSRIRVQAAEGKWTALAIFPGAFMLAWAVAFIGYASVERSTATTIIPYTTQFTIRFNENGRPKFGLLGDFLGDQQSGPAEVIVDGKFAVVVGEDREYRYQVHPEPSGESPLTLTGKLKHAADKRVEFHAELVLTRDMRVRVAGLEELTFIIDEIPRESSIDLKPGRYQLVIRGIRGG